MEIGKQKLSEITPGIKWAVIVNPNSGSRKGGRDWPEINRLLAGQGFQFEFVFTSFKNHAINLTREMIERGYRRFISVGGDGLLNEIANGIIEQNEIPSSDVILGMIPVGTGNDWCRTTGIPMDYKGAIEVILDGKTVLHDAGIIRYQQDGEVLTRYFVNMAGLGFDAEVSVKINQRKNSDRGGKKSYLFELASTLFRYHSTKMIIRYRDGDDITGIFSGGVFSLSAGIGKYNGGGMLQAPDARVDDGLFHVTIIKKLSPFSVILHIKKLYNGQIEKHPKVLIIIAKYLGIQSDPPVRIEADGESLGYSPFEISMLERRLRMIVKNDRFKN